MSNLNPKSIDKDVEQPGVNENAVQGVPKDVSPTNSSKQATKSIAFIGRSYIVLGILGVVFGILLFLSTESTINQNNQNLANTKPDGQAGGFALLFLGLALAIFVGSLVNIILGWGILRRNKIIYYLTLIAAFFSTLLGFFTGFLVLIFLPWDVFVIWKLLEYKEVYFHGQP